MVHQPLDWISACGRNEVTKSPTVGSDQRSAMITDIPEANLEESGRRIRLADCEMA